MSAALGLATVVIAVEPARADSGSFAGTCFASGGFGPFTMSISYDVDMPPLVAVGEHFTVPISVGTTVGALGELVRVSLVVSGAVPDDPGPLPNSIELTPSLPGDDDVSATVGLTASPGARAVRLAIGSVVTLSYVTSALVSCSGPVLARTWIDVAPPANDPTVSIGDATAAEGTLGPARIIHVPITLSSPSPAEVAVDVVFAGGTATPGIPGVGDVAKQPAVRKIRFRPSPHTGLTPTTKWLAVRVFPDADSSEGNETVEFDLANPTGGYGIYRGHGTATIRDDDSTVGVALSIGDVTVVEGASGSRLLKTSVSLSEPLGQDLTLDVVVDNRGSVIVDSGVDADANCVVGKIPPPGADCLEQQRRVKVRAGAVSRTVTFVVYPDTTLEFDEQFFVKAFVVPPTPGPLTQLSNPGTVTLLDDE